MHCRTYPLSNEISTMHWSFSKIAYNSAELDTRLGPQRVRHRTTNEIAIAAAPTMNYFPTQYKPRICKRPQTLMIHGHRVWQRESRRCGLGKVVVQWSSLWNVG